MTEKKAWRCRSCGQEHTPRCPTCRVVITGAEASAGRCTTCGSPVTAAIYTCPHCHLERGLQPPSSHLVRAERSLAVRALFVLRFLVGTTQMLALILFVAAACGGAPGGAAGASAGLLLFLALIPVQAYIIRRVKALTQGGVSIGERRAARGRRR